MNDTSNIVDESVAEALETMAFMAILPPEDDGCDPSDCMLVDVKFSGALSGVLEILAPQEFCEVLAGNMAATDDVSDAVRADGLKELCNVICGLILQRLATSKEDVFDVSVPAILKDGDVRSWADFCSLPGTAVFNADGYRVAVRIFLATSQA